MSRSFPPLQVARVSNYFHWVVGLASLVTVLTLIWMAAWADRGFDFTDEAFYLLWIQDPSRFKIGASLFGFVLNPIYEISRGSLGATRVGGFILIAAAGAGAAWSFLRTILPMGERTYLVRNVSFLLIAAGAPLTYYIYWLPTPSYNWLTLFSGLVLASAFGTLLAPARLWLSAFLAGTAGVFAFLAKPPSGVVFAVFYFAAILIVLSSMNGVAKQLLRGAIATTAVAFLVVLLVMPLGSIVEIYRGYFEVFGVGNPAAAGSAASLIRFLQTWSAGAYLIVLLVAITSTVTRRLPYMLVGVLGIGAFAIIYIDTDHPQRLFTLGVSAVALTTISIAGCLDAVRKFSRFLQMLLLVSLLPWGVAVGTENDLVIHASLSVSLPLLAGFLGAFAITKWRGAVSLASVGIIGITGTMLSSAVEKPYRLAAPLWAQTEAVMLSPETGYVRTDGATKKFIQEMRGIATREGFHSGTSLLDLTGYNPGIALILDANPPIVPWILGGYPFSEHLLRAVVEGMTPHERKTAWVIHSDAPIPFRTDVIGRLKIDLDRDYRLVGSIEHPVDKVPIRFYAPKYPL